MIDVSNDYIQMMRGRRLSNRIEITIINGEDEYDLTNDDVVKGSLSINWRASNNRDFNLGTCYASSMSFSSFTSVIPEVEGQSVTIIMSGFYKVGNGEQEIPLGVFRCDSPKVQSMVTTYDCTDYMLAFDQNVESRFSGTPYNVLTFICNRCGVSLANTAQQIGQMINSAQTVVIDPERVLTYRDALSYISIILGGYCIIDRSGRLSVRQFHSTPDMDLPRHRRTSTTFAGYKTIVNSVKCRFLAEQNFYPYEITDDTREGITVDLGDIPIIDDTDRTKNQILQNIFDLLKTYEYYPCEIGMVSDPCIEAGDMITTKDRYGYDRNIILTSVTFAWRSESNIMSEGGNPKDKSVSTAEKKNKAEQDAIAKVSQIVTATYVNANQITVDDSAEQEITSLRFVTNKDLTAIFGAEIPVYSSGDGYVEITYVNSSIEGDVVKARVHEGYNLITLVNHLHYDPNKIVLLQLMAQTEGIGSGSAPTLTIDQDVIRSYIFAQGLEVEAPWDGIIIISEEVAYVRTQMALYGLTETVSVSVQDPAESTLSEMVSAIQTRMQMISLSDTMTLTLEYGDQILRMGMGHRSGLGRMFAPIVI